MTALNLIVGTDRVDVFTDTAIYDMAKAGVVEGFGSKVIPLPHQGAVMAATGFSWVSIMMAGVIATTGIESFDELAARLPSVVSEAVARDPSGAAVYGKFELAIAGFSEVRGLPEAYVLYSYPAEGWPSWRMRKVSAYTSPQVPRRFDESDVVNSGLLIMEDQRESLCGGRGFEHVHFHAVGGAAQHARVSRDGVSISIIRRWPDVAGKRIEIS